MIKRNNETLKQLVCISVFSALAYAVTLVFHPPVSFLTLDVKDAVITVGAMIFGPLSAVIMSLICALLELVTVSSTGLYGFLMNFVGSCAFAGIASLIYHYDRTGVGATLAVLGGMLSMTAVMLGMNLVITPHFAGIDVEAVKAMIPTLLLPFNLAKGAINAALTVFLYKPISMALYKSGVIPKSKNQKQPEEKPGFQKSRTLAFTLAGIAFLLFGIVILTLLLP